MPFQPIVSAAVLGCALALPACARTHSATDSSERDRRAVADAVQALFRAAELKQVDRLETLHAFEPEFTKFDEFGQGREDADTAREAERRAVTGLKTFRADVRQLKVAGVGSEAAVATFILAYTAGTARGEIANTLRSTVVFAKRGDAWKIVHEHYSPLLARQ